MVAKYLTKYNIQPLPPTKEQLQELYINQQLSLAKIAPLFNLSKVQISNYLQKYGIEVIKYQREFEKNKNYVFSQQQREFIIGGLLGDSSISLNKGNKSARLSIGHCIKQVEYCKWKYELIKDICGDFQYNNKSKHPSCGFHSKSTLTFLEFERLFYQDRIKIVNRSILDQLTPFALAIWYMDDGCLDKYNNRSILYTNCFTYQEHLIMQQFFFERFNLVARIKSRTYPTGKTYYFLIFNTTNSRKLCDIIRPFVHEIMKYKLLPEKSTNI